MRTHAILEDDLGTYSVEIVAPDVIPLSRLEVFADRMINGLAVIGEQQDRLRAMVDEGTGAALAQLAETRYRTRPL